MLKKFLIAVSLCSICLAPAIAQMQGQSQSSQSQDQTAAVTAVVEKLRAQMVTPDKAALSALVADELSYGHSGGKVDTKASFIDDLLTGVSDFLSIQLADQTVRVVGDTAIVRHTLIAGTHDKGKQPDNIKLHVLLVLSKQSGEWKLLARQAVRPPA